MTPVPLPHDPGPHWGEVGIHGLHRQREWDVVVAIDAPDVPGQEGCFVVLADGRVVVEEDDGGAVARLARSVPVAAPFRARAVRRGPDTWAVAARRIETVELAADPGGDFVEIAWDGLERTVRIDGEPTLAGVPELERLGASLHETYVVTAARLAGVTWEVSVAPL
jgi:hypothetical protein